MLKKVLDEEITRLKMLCKRVRQLFKQVQSTKDFKKIKNIINELIEIEKESNQIEEKYNSKKINADRKRRKKVLSDMIALTRFEILIFSRGLRN